MTRLLLCTDLDRTLLPNGPQPESPLARQRFNQLVAHEHVTLAYVTGRHQALVEKAIKNYSIPQPDFVIANVGATIYQIDNRQWQVWDAWENTIDQDWNGKSRMEIHEVLSEFRDLRLQEVAKQSTHKLSYYVPRYIKQQPLLKQMQDRLEAAHIRANLIWSVDEQANIGLLDVLPASAGKRQAIEFLMQQLDYSLQQTVFAGDSGNDIDVMASPIQSVLVANASDEVRKAAVTQAHINQQSDHLYLARGDYMGMNGNYSAGILEGVAHYLPHTEDWFRGAA